MLIFFLPGVGAVATAITRVSEQIFKKLTEDNFIFDEMKKRFNAAIKADNINELYQLLPELFATDIKNYFNSKKHKKKASIVFLDTYEKLVNEAKMTYEERARDLWLRGNSNGLMAIMPNTLWVIAGRTELKWNDKNYTKIPVQNEIIHELSQEESEKVLEKSGVENPELRKDLFELTKGFPIFLTLCVDIYEQYKQQWSKEPNIEEFGGEREKVVQRILKYMDARYCQRNWK